MSFSKLFKCLKRPDNLVGNTSVEDRKPYLSIIIPSIRPDRLEALYESVLRGTKRSFELVVVGPYPLPKKLEKHNNIKVVRDFGSAARAHNIGLLFCEGEIITWIADDAIVLDGAVDSHLEGLESMGPDSKNVVVSKYYEGQKDKKHRNELQPDSYYRIVNNLEPGVHIPDDWWIFNVAYTHREFLYALGGWDASYEGPWASSVDLAIRAQAAGAVVVMSDIPRDFAEHMPGVSGDHAPIHHAHLEHDVPLLTQRFSDPAWREQWAVPLNLMNWKSAPSVWGRRFNP